MSTDYTPVEVNHGELLRYHLNLTSRIDKEQEIKAHTLALARLTSPAAQPPHQHAAISHAAQQTPENQNNVNAAKVHEAAKAVIAKDDEASRQLTKDQEEDQRKAMAEQINSAAKRTAPAEIASPAAGNGGGNDSNAPAAPAAKSQAIPTWKP